MQRMLRATLAALVVLAAGALFAPAAMAASDPPGAVYTLTNSPAGNAVLVYGVARTARSPRPARSRPAAPAAAPGSDRRTR
jgi:hypothetical protein